jgi:hypothetical protein
MNQKVADSFLGHNPHCIVCLELIKPGDRVKQTFIGEVIVDSDGGELGIVEEKYELMHITCNRSHLALIKGTN